ncbi:MAG: fimbrillin family protein, partial [Alistipes sp.]|nr:fimbrillin family protein [Alistipes sp.]
MICVAAVSCGAERVETKGGEIRFSAPLTRGTAISDADGVASAGGFTVWAYSHPGAWSDAAARTAIFEGTAVTRPGTEWSYGTARQWPVGMNISFFAFAPAGTAGLSVSATDGVPEITFAVADDITAQTDLLIAREMFDAQGPSPVPVVFDHALARVEFSAVKSPETAGEVVITAARLEGVADRATAPMLSPVEWSTEEEEGSYRLESGVGLRPGVALSGAAQPLTAAGWAMFMIPQGLSAATMTVEYSVDGEELSWSGPVPSAGWSAGRRYDYLITIDRVSVDLTEIVFDLESGN